jgi:hypothetical protein
VPAEGAATAGIRRFLSKNLRDMRADNLVAAEVLAVITEAGAISVVMADRIIGCPHEEGIDYQGPTCPFCPFWAGRHRWTGKRLH